jgi:hypothetical protein
MFARVFETLFSHRPVVFQEGSRRGLSVVEAVEALRPVWHEQGLPPLKTNHTDRATLACLGRQSQARAIQRVKKASCTLECVDVGQPTAARLQGPAKHFSPTRGKRVGGVSERPTRARREEQSSMPPGRGGGKHLVFGMPAPFAGRRRNGDLGRSVACDEVSSSACARADDEGCSLGAEEGNDVGSSQQSVSTRREGNQKLFCYRGRVLHSVQRPVHVTPRKWEAFEVSRSGKPASAGGTGRRGLEGRTECAARRVPPLPRGRSRGASDKEEGRGLRPCEETRARVAVPARRSSCRSRKTTPGLE